MSIGRQHPRLQRVLRTRVKTVFVGLSGLLLFWVLSAVSYAQSPPLPPECQQASLPTGDSDNPEQLALVCVPQVWNGQLVVYAHGYVPPQLPLALPLAELIVEGQNLPQVLLSRGFAFATSSFRKNGYAIEQAGQDLNQLVDYFNDQVAPRRAQRVLLVGTSEGGLVTAMLLERYPQKYQGGLSLCGPVGGAPYQVKYLGDFRVVFDYFFPTVFSFGAFQASPLEYLKWGNASSGYVHDIGAALLSKPGATRQLFNVTRAALNPLDQANSALNTSLSILFYSIWGNHDLLSTTGGVPYQNRFTFYFGSQNDVALNLGVERVNSDPEARRYLRQFYQTSGNLFRPLVTLHTTLDPVVPFSHELIYTKLTTLQGRRHLLTVLPVVRYGHCNFTAAEVLGAFGLLGERIRLTAQPRDVR